MTSILQNHTAGAQSIGFDYQFYYFMYLALSLKFGEKVGFEVKDDIHIDMPDGSTILFQAKHSIQTNSSDDTVNLTNLDIDLWKTLSNWSKFIKSDKIFIDKHSFILVTNKNENNNEFIDSLLKFKELQNIDDINQLLNELKEKTTDKTLKKYISKVLSLGKKQKKHFFGKLIIETGVDNIIEKIKRKILERVMQDKFVEPIFEKLSSNLHSAKYLDIKSRNKFEISLDEFINRFGKCFSIAFEKQVLPRREFPILLPDNLEKQTFIKQLIDIEDLQKNDTKYIRKYTYEMLIFLRHFTYWSDEENFILLTDAEEFEKESIKKWENAFRERYRTIERQLSNGTSIEDLEDDIKTLGVDLVDFIRKENLSIGGYPNLGIEFSNGHYYSLSDKLKIGWHYDWENKYKK